MGADAAEVHALLCECDAYTATPEAPAPVRNFETTLRRVREGSVHVLRHGAGLVAMFTLTWDAPFAMDTSVFPPARKPAYLGRLAVKPEYQAEGSLAGVRCLRKAVELATDAGADAIRAEANPDLTRVRALLRLFDFEEYGLVKSEGENSRAYLQKNLRPAAP